MVNTHATDPKVVEKVKKLLRLAQEEFRANHNVHEVQLAMEKAEQLARKFGIRLDQLTEEESHNFIEHRLCTGVYVDIKDHLICEVLQSNYNVKTFVWGTKGTKCGIAFVGLEEHVQLSLVYFEYLRATAEKVWKTKGQDRSFRADWMLGFFSGLYTKLDLRRKVQESTNFSGEEVATQTALVVKHNQDLDKFVNDKYAFKEVEQRKVSPWNAHHEDGWKEGEKVDLSRQLGN